MTFALLLDDICEHCRIFKYVACRRPSEFHQSKRVVPRCGQILVFGLSHAASQPRSRSGQRTQSFHHSYWSMFNVQCLIFIAHCSMFVIQCTVFKVLCLVFDALCSILKIRPTHTINPSDHSHCTIPYNCNFFSTNKFSRKVCDHTIPPSLTDQNPFFPLSSTLTNSIKHINENQYFIDSFHTWM